jgi:hypothetical protein
MGGRGGSGGVWSLLLRDLFGADHRNSVLRLRPKTRLGLCHLLCLELEFQWEPEIRLRLSNNSLYLRPRRGGNDDDENVETKSSSPFQTRLKITQDAEKSLSSAPRKE